MTKVTLHGELAEAMGKAEWEFMLQQPREVLAALEANTGTLYQYLQRRHDESGGAVQYRVVVDGRDIGGPKPEEISAEFYAVGVFVRIDIIPVLQGAAGLWQTIIGVVLIIVGVILFWTPLAAIAPYVIAAGISLTLGGIAAMLTPTPKLGTSAFARSFAPPEQSLGLKKEDAKNTPSYLFSGAVNTTQQGNPVPIAYGGPMIVGSALISMSITTASLSSSIIGAQRPPPANDAFFDYPVWTRVQALPSREPIKTLTLVKRLTAVQTQTIARGFGFPAVYPAGWGTYTGKPVWVGDTTLGYTTYKGLLATLSRLFSGDPRSIKFVEVQTANELLGIFVLHPATATWKTHIITLARHFSPEP